MRRIILLFVGFVCLLQFSYSQKLNISGTITAKEDGLPIIGASVVEKGTTNGTITNFDGIFNISVSNGIILEISYVGMETKEIKINGPNKLNIVLKSSAIAIDEVVVTAMGIKQEKKRMNFAVQSVNSDALTENKSPNFINALQGKVAGLSVTKQF